MALPEFTMRQMLEAGIHFGHSTRRWNPRMDPYLFGVRNKVHIIDLQQTVPMLHRSMSAVRDIIAGGGRMLFVGTKRQASEKISESAKRCGQYYVNHRWLGGMMTNWQTMSKSIKRLRNLDKQFEAGDLQLTKKEQLKLSREREKLERALGGIKEMGGLPDVLFVIDVNKEAIAVAEANKLGIPVVGVVDSNTNPDGIDFLIPGNDDAIRAITFYCDMMVGAVLDGIQQEVGATGGDVGAADEPLAETLPENKDKAGKGKKAAKDDQPSAKKPAKANKSPKADKSEAVAPEAVAPVAVAPEAVAPEAVAPEAVAPEAVAPEAVTAVSEAATDKS